MIIACFRCDKAINTPDKNNADYIIAEDTIVEEHRPHFIQIPKTTEELLLEEATLQEELKKYKAIIKDYEESNIEPQSLPIEDIYDEVAAIEEELIKGPNSDKLVTLRGKKVQIQKTGIICPDCYLDTDFVIWGVHKGN